MSASASRVFSDALNFVSARPTDFWLHWLGIDNDKSMGHAWHASDLAFQSNVIPCNYLTCVQSAAEEDKAGYCGRKSYKMTQAFSTNICTDITYQTYTNTEQTHQNAICSVFLTGRGIPSLKARRFCAVWLSGPSGPSQILPLVSSIPGVPKLTPTEAAQYLRWTMRPHSLFTPVTNSFPYSSGPALMIHAKSNDKLINFW